MINKILHQTRGWRRGFSAGLAALALCLSASAEEIPVLLEPVGVQIDTAEAYIGDISTLSFVDGSVVPYVEELYFPLEGYVDEISVIVGQEVKAGDVLLTLNQESEKERIAAINKEIDKIEVNAEYEKSLTDIDLAILELELNALTAQTPRDESAIALKKLDIEEFKLSIEMDAALREMELSRLRSELETLEAEIHENALVAPFDGQVVYCASLQKGSYISAYTPIVYLADNTQLSIKSEFISTSTLEFSDIYALIEDRRYELTPILLSNEDYITISLTGETPYSEFVIDDPDDLLAAGQYAAVCTESKRSENVLLIPSNAVYSDSAGYYVYLITDGERIHQPVGIGLRNAWLTEITEGLEEGDVVYVKE